VSSLACKLSPLSLTVYLSLTQTTPLFHSANINQELSNKIAKELGLPEQQPLQVKPASEAIRFRPNLANSSKL